MKLLGQCLMLILIAAFITNVLQGQKLPEREYTFRIPQRLGTAYGLLLQGRVDDIPLGQYKELNKIIGEQADMQQKQWFLQDSIAAAKLKPIAPIKKDSSDKKN